MKLENYEKKPEKKRTPSLFIALTSAPLSSRTSATDTFPVSAAFMSAVFPNYRKII
jgi:hypothetical protein